MALVVTAGCSVDGCMGLAGGQQTNWIHFKMVVLQFLVCNAGVSDKTGSRSWLISATMLQANPKVVLF